MPLLNYLFKHRKLGIKRSDLVIEIGPGGDPLLRSDIFVEKYIEDDTERHTRIIVDRPTVAADGVMLPFHDKSIEYIICSHVLEHIINPKPFLEEMSRVGKKGLIITPQAGYERLHPKGGHLWYIWSNNGVLYFKQKKCWNEYPEVREYFRKVTRLPGYWSLWGKHYDIFNTIFEWSSSINCQIEQEEMFDLSNFKKATGTRSYNTEIKKPIKIRQRAKSIVAKYIRPMISAHWKIDINEIICCPLCKGKLTTISISGNSTHCKGCGAIFPVRQSIARLLQEEASISGK